MTYKIPLSKPALDNADKLELLKNFDSTWISSKSPWVEKFEKLFAQKVSQTKYAVSVNSGTSALFLALKALGVGPGNEVILPAFTMIATINAVTWVGAKPILVDSVSKKDWNMDPTQIETKITKHTKAIIPVHIYGYPCDMQTIMRIAKKHHLYMVEDAAEAMGSTCHGQRLGSFGDLSCFSLYANKIITTGNGGMVVANNHQYYELIKKLSFFDFNEKSHFKHKLIGYNLVLSGLQAALGVSQIKKFNKLLKKRRQIYRWYRELLKNNPNVSFITSDQSSAPNFWFPAIIVKSPKQKVKLVKALDKAGIETRHFFLPLHRQPVYQKLFHKQTYPVADYFHQHGLLLPSYFALTKTQVQKIGDLISRATA